MAENSLRRPPSARVAAGQPTPDQWDPMGMAQEMLLFTVSLYIMKYT